MACLLRDLKILSLKKLLILIIFQISDDFVVFHDALKLIIRKSYAFKIDLNTEDYFGKTGISYLKIKDQEEMKSYMRAHGLKNNVALLVPDSEKDLLNGFKLQCQTE